MEFESYKQFWNHQAATPESALAAVDGSASEEVVRITGRFTARQVATAIELNGDDRLLELGCGVGRIGRELAPHCAHWTGVDISDKMISHARERLGHLDNTAFHQLSRTALDSLDDGSLTKAYSVAVLCHMDKEDLYLYLKELHRTVRPGGLIYIETWNLAHPIGWKRWEYEVNHWNRSDQKLRKDVARNQFCTPDEFELYVRQAGFTPLATYSGSPWVQVIAGHSPDEEAVARQHRRLAEQASAIAYSPLFGRLFEQTVDVIFGVLHPRKVLEFLDQHGDQPETPLFRPFIETLWRKNPQLWGDIEG
ncbi:MAG: class I SAM-dependent methyltransferase [Xanthomonadales bacterium]|nr:class I SAM-dependent methyltransferase [Xanthomonadales bacterium]